LVLVPNGVLSIDLSAIHVSFFNTSFDFKFGCLAIFFALFALSLKLFCSQAKFCTRTLGQLVPGLNTNHLASIARTHMHGERAQTYQ